VKRIAAALALAGLLVACDRDDEHHDEHGDEHHEQARSLTTAWIEVARPTDAS